MRKTITIVIFFAVLCSFVLKKVPPTIVPYLSPTHILCAPASGKAFVSLSGAGRIAVVGLKSQRTKKYLSLPFNPGGMALLKENKKLLVTDQLPDGKVHIISVKNGRILRSIPVGHTPDALVITPDGQLAFVANRFSNSVSVIDLTSYEVIKEIAVDRDPKVMALSPDGNLVAVGNNIPNDASTDSLVSAKISLLDQNTLEVIQHVSLVNGSHSIEGLAFSKDGAYLYASHILSRNKLPTTQIERGWINSNALSMIDVETRSHYSTVLLDDFNKGAANPAGLAVSTDGNQLAVALSGVHEIAVIDLMKLHEKLNKKSDPLSILQNDMRFLSGIKTRISTKGKSPRHLAFINDRLLVSSYFATDLEFFAHFEKGNQPALISLGNEPEMSVERKGELLFCDADLCFQKWQSCVSCHPDARADGLNWDLLNDGAGNPKNTKSMLRAHETPPVMITGIRENAEIAVRSGIKFILFTACEEADARPIDAYLKSLEPVPSPYLKNGRLSINAFRGKELFEKAGCLKCHSGRNYTDGKQYYVGTGVASHQGDQFDVPGLVEVWRTAPYLYDGRAKSMKEVFTKFNPNDTHGATSQLSDQELEDLVAYVLSL